MMATFLPRPEVPSKDLSSIPPPASAIMQASSVPMAHKNGPRIQTRVPTDYRGNDVNNGNGALPIAGPQANMANGAPRRRGTMGAGPPGFDGPRSPPNTKSISSLVLKKEREHRLRSAGLDTSHVPCKFFRSGLCQAGKACPFSHSTDISTVDTPCKYFAKGNCKFGAKCALAHILPNGRRVNRPNGLVGGHLNLGGRVDPQSFHPQDSALANSLLAQQAGGIPSTFGHQFSQFPENGYGPQTGLHAKVHDNVPSIDTSYTSPRGSAYGSPPDNGNGRLPISPAAHLSALDAPLPASFDSQGISFAARHGPVAHSVPSKFGLDSPPSSLSKKTALPSDALRNLHDSAFGRETRGRAPPNLGSSPLGSGDEGLGQRLMHSQRITKPKMVSASLPRQRANDDWDDGFLFGGEEDFLPTSLHDLLTPQEKSRTLSRSEQDPLAFRESLSGLGTPADSSKVGSPTTASPSRYGALFARQRREEDGNNADRTSAFGHVGSPLRNSSLHPNASPSLRATSLGHPVSGDMSPYYASPPRQSSMSVISQQLSRTRLSSRTDTPNVENSNSNNALHPGSASTRHASGSNGRLDRAASSSSIGTSRIDEEQGDCVFSMEVEEDTHTKRWSGGPWNGQGAR